MKNFVFAFLTVFVLMGLFLSPLVAADNPNPIVGEWVWKSKEMTNILLVSPSSPVEKDGEFSGSFRNFSAKGSGMLFSFGQGKVSGERIDFVLYSLHPDGCGGAVVSGEIVKSGEEMVLIFSPSPSTTACSSSGKPFTAVFKKAVTGSSKVPVGDGPIN